MKSELFKVTRKAYESCLKDIKEMAKYIEKAFKKEGQEFDHAKTLKQFDIILQYSMLQIAVADNRTEASEIELIRDIVKYGDFCEYLKMYSGRNEFSWSVILAADETSLSRLLDAIQEDIRKLVNEFITVFVVADSALKQDYFTDFKSNVSLILAATCQADGDARKEELNGCAMLSVLGAMESILK